MSDLDPSTLDALNASWADTGRHLEEKEWNKKHKRDEEQVEKKQKTEKESPESSSSSEEEEEEEEDDEDDDDYILLVDLAPQPHCRISDGDGGCENVDMEIQIKCHKIPVSDLGKSGTPFVSCKDVKDLQRFWRQYGSVLDEGGKERYRVYNESINDDDTIPNNTILDLSLARYQVVFV